MVNVRLKLCRNHRREEQQHAQLNTLWATDAIRNAHRQTDRQGSLGSSLHAICQSMNYSRGWEWGFSSQSVQQIQSLSLFFFFFLFLWLPSSLIKARTPGRGLQSGWQQEIAEQTWSKHKSTADASHDQLMNRSNLTQQKPLTQVTNAAFMGCSRNTGFKWLIHISTYQTLPLPLFKSMSESSSLSHSWPKMAPVWYVQNKQKRSTLNTNNSFHHFKDSLTLTWKPEQTNVCIHTLQLSKTSHISCVQIKQLASDSWPWELVSQTAKKGKNSAAHSAFESTINTSANAQSSWGVWFETGGCIQWQLICCFFI